MINSAIVHVWLPTDLESKSGVLEHLKARLYKAGTYGHVSLELIIPKNEKSIEIIEKYLGDSRIPHFETECKSSYKVYWSFYPTTLETLEEDQNKFYGKRNTEWAQKYKCYFNPPSEVIEPKLNRFIENTPYLKYISKIPGFMRFLKFSGFDNFPPPYQRTMGIKSIEHRSLLLAKTSSLEKEKLALTKQRSENLPPSEKAILSAKLYKLEVECNKIKRECTTTGKPADHVFHIPATLYGSSSELSFIEMIKKMRTIDINSGGKFDLYSLNCSETVLRILSAGTFSTSIFEERGWIFKSANPNLVKNLCEKYITEFQVNDTIVKAPPLKKIRLCNTKINYTEISEPCSIEALGKCNILLNSNDATIPYLSSNMISELHQLLSDDTADFACQVYNEKGEVELVDPKILLNEIRMQAFEKANLFKNKNNNKNIDIIDTINENTNSQNPKKRKREMVDGLL